jgi:hypothetical protein
MGHARCEKLMGFNMGLASVRRRSGEGMMLVAAHAFCEEAAESGFQAKWKYTEFGKHSHRPSRELGMVLEMVSNTNIFSLRQG